MTNKKNSNGRAATAFLASALTTLVLAGGCMELSTGCKNKLEEPQRADYKSNNSVLMYNEIWDFSSDTNDIICKFQPRNGTPRYETIEYTKTERGHTIDGRSIRELTPEMINLIKKQAELTAELEYKATLSSYNTIKQLKAQTQ
jgi:hypothetical protein